MDRKIQQRNAQIVKLHAKHKTQQEIASKLNLTRQRVQQIEKELGLKRIRVPSKGYRLVCKYSGEIFYSRNKNQRYAKREYFYLARRKYKTPEQIAAYLEKKREKNRKKAAWYYHHVFKKRSDWREVVRARNIKYAVSTSNRKTSVT